MSRSSFLGSTLLALAILMFAGGAARKPVTPPPARGQRVPDFTLVDQDGRRVSLSAARGRKAVLVFYRGYW